MATIGTTLVYFAINDVPLLDGFRALLKGKVLTGPQVGAKKGGVAAALGDIADKARTAANTPTAAGSATFGTSSSPGQAIADDARRYLGVPYKWGGADPSGFDCSGLVTWVLHHDLGYNLPSNTHTVTGQFLVWGGATDVARSSAQAGDLCCSMGHIGIAVDGSNMIHAPDLGEVVKVGPIQAGMAIRRVTTPSTYAQNEKDTTQRWGG